MVANIHTALFKPFTRGAGFLRILLFLVILIGAVSASVSGYPASPRYAPGRYWQATSSYPVYNIAYSTIPGAWPPYTYTFFPGYSWGPTYLYRGWVWDYPTYPYYRPYAGYYGRWYGYSGRWNGYYGNWNGYSWNGYYAAWPDPWHIYNHYRW